MTSEPWILTREMFLAEAEVEQLLTHLNSRLSAKPDEKANAFVDKLIIHSLLYSGLRNSEFCQLRVIDTVIGIGKSVFEVRGTPRQDRTVFVPQSLSALVRRYVEEFRPDDADIRAGKSTQKQPLVLNERSRPYERTSLYRRVVRILTEAGFGARASVQLLRHTYGYLGYKRTGGNLLFLQKQLGHAHPMVTSVYAEFADEDYATLADRVGGNAPKAIAPKQKRLLKRHRRKGLTR